MRKSSLKLGVGLLSLMAASAAGAPAAAHSLDLKDETEGLFFTDSQDGGTAVSYKPTSPKDVRLPPEIKKSTPETIIQTTPIISATAAKKPVVAKASPTPEQSIKVVIAKTAPEAIDNKTAAVITRRTKPLTSWVAANASEYATFAVADQDSSAPLSVDAPAPPVIEKPIEDDGLGADGAYITADEVTSPQDNILIARGSVEMRYDGRLIRADEVWYDQTTGKTIASGNTQTINPDGSVQYADRLEFDNTESTGVGDRIASIDAENSKLFANKVERIDADKTQLTEVIFTPCELCVKDNVTQNPTWSIQAESITQDRKNRVVVYRNAVFMARGVPVLYLPVLWHADPGAKRASGLLMPKIGSSKRRGFSLELPYLWAVSPYTDVIVSPKFSSKVNPLLNLEVNRRFYSGDFNSRFGYTYEAFFDNESDKWGKKEGRGYILADGNFDINPDWRWDFTLQHVFDKADDGRSISNFYERYKISDGFPRVGEYISGSRELINQVNLTRQTNTAYLSLSLASFQSLRIGAIESIDPSSAQLIQYAPADSTLPVVAPMVEAVWTPEQDILGGRLTVSATGVSIIRRRQPVAEITGGATGPVDSARASLGLSWRRDLITPMGLKVSPFIEARHDQYRISDYDTDPDTDDRYNVSRSLSTAGIDLSYPLVRKFNGFTAVIEPVAQLAVSPESEISPYLTNEDSQTFEFDDTTLFKANKSPGFDLYEGGQRVSLGLKTRFNFDNGLKFSTLIGRTFRADPELAYLKILPGTAFTYDPAGLAGKKSDWVVQADFDTSNGFYGYSRMRLDSDNGALRRGDLGFSYIRNETQATVRYVVDNTRAGFIGPEFRDDLSRYEDLEISAQHFFTQKWGVAARVNRNMMQSAWIHSEVSLIYRDDCTRVDLVYQRDESALYRLADGNASESISVRISLATLTTPDADFSNIR